MQLPVGEKTMIEVACDKGVTSYYASNSGGDVRDFSDPDSPCPRQPVETFHTPGIWYLGGCALSVAYKSDINDVQPEDLVIFSVNHTCVWNLHTYFETPKDMPPCPNGKCICAWHWIHRKMYGPEQSGLPSILSSERKSDPLTDYVAVVFMNGFQCNFTGATSTQPLAKPQVPRRYIAPSLSSVSFDLMTTRFGNFIPNAQLRRRAGKGQGSKPVELHVRRQGPALLESDREVQHVRGLYGHAILPSLVQLRRRRSERHLREQ